MEYFYLKGFLVLLLTKHCTSEALPTSVLSSTVTLEDAHTSLHEPEWSPAEIVPVVAPPNLEEVQQAVQEASEKVEGGTAEDVLKELLERVVEAALGQVEGKQDEPAEEEGAGEDAVGIEMETQVDLSEQMMVGMDGGGEEAQETEEGEGETIADIMKKTTVGGDTVGTDFVFEKSLDGEVIQEVVEETVATLEEIGKDVAIDNGQVEESNKQEVLLQGRLKTEKTPTFLKFDLYEEPKQETSINSALVTEQIVTVKQIEADAAVGEMEAKVIALPSDNSDREATQPVTDEPAFSVDNYTVKDPKNLDDVEQSHIEEEGEPIEMEGWEIDSKSRESHQDIIEQEYVVLATGGDGQQPGGEPVTLQTLKDHNEHLETTMISAPKPEDDVEDSIEQKPENQDAAAPSTALSGLAETIFTNHGNEILSPTDELLAPDSNVAQATLVYFVKDVLEFPPQAKGDQVEDTAGAPETKEMGLEAWKIGATIAAVLLVLETFVIIVYIYKRNKNSSLATQHSCEEGCVEPEVTTGGDSSDDTLHAENGEVRQITSMDLYDATTTVAQNTQGHTGEHVISMSNLPDDPTAKSAYAGPGPDSSKEARSSRL